MDTDETMARRSRGRLLLGGLLVLASLIFLATGCESTAPVSSGSGSTEHWKGNRDAKVVIEEWTDLQ